MHQWFRGILLTAAIGSLLSAPVGAQVSTGAITGAVHDASGAVLPGVSVSLSGSRLIGGVQTQATDSSGSYRFDRLPPGPYDVGGTQAMQQSVPVHQRHTTLDRSKWRSDPAGR